MALGIQVDAGDPQEPEEADDPDSSRYISHME